MRIDLLAPPFRGHLHPTIAMARELASEFDVRVLSTPGVVPAIEASGIKALAILSADDEARCFAIANVSRPVRANPLRLHGQMREAIALMSRLHVDLRAAYREAPPHLLIADFVLAGVGVVADELGIPWWTSMRSPSVVETPDGPPAYLGGLGPATSAVGRLRLAVARRLIRVGKRGLFFTQRGALHRMGIDRLYRSDGSEALYSPHRILAAGIERFEFPATLPTALKFVGPHLYTPPSKSAPPPFAEGRAHVLVTCGTHLPWFKDRLARASAQVAAALPDVVVHFSDGAPDSDRADAAGNFVRLGYVDYDRHLSRYAAVVHHAGSGVLYGCLTHGVPAVVFPLDYDQFDNAARAEAAGLARWIRTLDALPDAVRAVLADDALKARCAAMRDELRSLAAERRVLSLVRDFARERTNPA
jgi:UDP:flavonoid glycosyltransferase YjiC (YdhE family)